MILKVRCCCILALFLFTGWCRLANARQIADMAGRLVTVPDVIHKVYGTSPPATYLVYAFDPELVAGLNSPLRLPEKQYIDNRMKKLPVVGGWFGLGQVCNIETLLKLHPDIILVWRWNKHAFNEKIEQTLKPLKIPIVYVTQDSLSDYPPVFRFLGELFDRQEKAEALSRYAEQTLLEINSAQVAIGGIERVTVYYAEGADGLSTECSDSVHAQMIPLSGGRNVHRCDDSTTYGMQKVSMEQVLQYDPQVIVSHEPLFYDTVDEKPGWKNIRAVRDGRVYRIPRAPFNWFDRPPSFMRLLGAKWLTNKLYPQVLPMDMVAETQRFYLLFLNVTLDPAAAGKLLEP